MLAPVLATEDPYAAATVFCQAGWKLEYETSRSGPQPRACVSLALSRVVLVPGPTGGPRGHGVELELTVPPAELSGLFLLHRAVGVAVTDLRKSPSGERAFRAEIAGYTFVIVGGDPDPDLAAVATDPRITALADGLRQRDGDQSLITSALRLAEGSGESVRRLRRGLSAGLPDRQRDEVVDELAEVVLAAAILARQLRADLEGPIQRKLGSAGWNVTEFGA